MLVSFFNINHHALALFDLTLHQCHAGYTYVLASREYTVYDTIASVRQNKYRLTTH